MSRLAHRHIGRRRWNEPIAGDTIPSTKSLSPLTPYHDTDCKLAVRGEKAVPPGPIDSVPVMVSENDPWSVSARLSVPWGRARVRSSVFLATEVVTLVPRAMVPAVPTVSLLVSLRRS